MKTKIGILMIVLFAALSACRAQDRITARAVSYDISDNLDLKAVATQFGESRNLEEFEQRLNDPELQISNLDLNQDGYVDYLRVIETRDNGISEVIIQAVLGENVYQDVATINVEREQGGSPVVQIIGDPYIYGPDYIFEPVWTRTPLIFGFFWGPAYRPWHSPYYWGHYPTRFHYWRPFTTFRYHRNLSLHVSIGARFNFNINRRIVFPHNYQNTFRRDDYARRYPDHSFSHRHQGIKNKTELNRRRPTNANYERRTNNRNIHRERPETYRTRPERRTTETRPERRKIERQSEKRNTETRQETKVTRKAPDKRVIVRHPTEPVRQPRKNNVVTRPNRRIETTKKTTITTHRTKTAPRRSRSVKHVKSSPKTQKNLKTTDKKSNNKRESRRRE